VEIQFGAAPPPDPSCVGEPTTAACDPTLFSDARRDTLDLIDRARALIASGDATMRGHVDRLFGAGTPSSDVDTGLRRIREQIVAEVTLTPRPLPAGGTEDRVVCGTRCHPDCRRGFDAVTTGLGATSVIVLCPTFFGGGAQTSALLAHETSHATEGMRPFGSPAGEGTEDLAYFGNRLITRLGRLGLENATTYQVLLLLVAGVTPRLGPGVTDTLAFPPARAADQDVAVTVVAQAERWAEATGADISFAYGEMSEALHGSPATPIDSSGYNADTIRDLDALFTIRNPGQDPVTAPIVQNMWRMAGIRDRYETLFGSFRGALTFTPRSSGGVRWHGSTIEFGPGFFAATDVERVQMVLRAAMALARTDPRGGLRAGLVSSYIDFATRVHARRGLPP
jgi:hypothetical protein